MHIVFNDFIKKYKAYLRKTKWITTGSYLKDTVVNSFCYSYLITKGNYLCAVWDDIGIDNFMILVYDELDKNNNDSSIAKKIRIALFKLSEFLHFEYKQYDNIPILEGDIVLTEERYYADQQEEYNKFYETTLERILALDNSLFPFINEIRQIPNTKPSEWRELFEKIDCGDESAKKRLTEIQIKPTLRIALYFAEKYHLPLSDTIQDGLVGLIKAIDKYNSKGSSYNFQNYYGYYVMNSIQRSIPEYIFPTYVPIHIYEKLDPIIEYANYLSVDLLSGCFDNDFIRKVCSKFSISEDLAFLYIKSILPSLSLDYLNEIEDDENDEEPLIQWVDYEQEEVMIEELDRELLRDTLPDSIAFLKPRELDVLLLRYGINDGVPRTLEQVGQRFGLTRERVRQIEAKAFKRINAIRRRSQSEILKSFIPKSSHTQKSHGFNTNNVDNISTLSNDTHRSNENDALLMNSIINNHYENNNVASVDTLQPIEQIVDQEQKVEDSKAISLPNDAEYVYIGKCKFNREIFVKDSLEIFDEERVDKLDPYQFYCALYKKLPNKRLHFNAILEFFSVSANGYILRHQIEAISNTQNNAENAVCISTENNIVSQDMVSEKDLVRHVNVQTETIRRYIKEGKLIPDKVVSINGKNIGYYSVESINKYAKQYDWVIITKDNIVQLFIDTIKKMDMSYSYKPVFIKALLEHVDIHGKADFSNIINYFIEYYKMRKKDGLFVEKTNCLIVNSKYTDKDVARLIINNPYRRFEDMGFVKLYKDTNIIEINPIIWENLPKFEMGHIKLICDQKLIEYYKRFN